MSFFEYQITKHPAEEFNKFTYFCTSKGECSIDELPERQVEIFVGFLNKRGAEGWELIEIFFGKDGIVAFWKRAV
jgi:hypothetical protein